MLELECPKYVKKDKKRNLIYYFHEVNRKVHVLAAVTDGLRIIHQKN